MTINLAKVSAEHMLKMLELQTAALDDLARIQKGRKIDVSHVLGPLETVLLWLQIINAGPDK